MAGSKEAKSKVAKMRLPLSRQKLPQHRASRCVSILIKPLRIFQFVRRSNISLHFSITSQRKHVKIKID